MLWVCDIFKFWKQLVGATGPLFCGKNQSPSGRHPWLRVCRHAGEIFSNAASGMENPIKGFGWAQGTFILIWQTDRHDVFPFPTYFCLICFFQTKGSGSLMVHDDARWCMMMHGMGLVFRSRNSALATSIELICMWLNCTSHNLLGFHVNVSLVCVVYIWNNNMDLEFTMRVHLLSAGILLKWLDVE